MPRHVLLVCAAAAATFSFARAAHADPFSLDQVRVLRLAYAVPPPGNQPIIVAQDPPEPVEIPEPVSRELYRAPMRFHLGPLGVTSGRGLGLGLGIAADFGRGSVGFRVAAAWARGESGSSGATPAPLSDGLGQYTGELTLDFHKRGPVHPIFGVGFGLAHINRGDLSGNMGIGIARLGVEYAVSLDDADVRLGLGVTGALPGPADREVQDVKGYAIVGASIGIGF